MGDLEEEEDFDSEEDAGKKRKGAKSAKKPAAAAAVSGGRSTRSSGLPAIEITAPKRPTRSRGPPVKEESEEEEKTIPKTRSQRKPPAKSEIMEVDEEGSADSDKPLAGLKLVCSGEF